MATPLDALTRTDPAVLRNPVDMYTISASRPISTDAGMLIEVPDAPPWPDGRMIPAGETRTVVEPGTRDIAFAGHAPTVTISPVGEFHASISEEMVATDEYTATLAPLSLTSELSASILTIAAGIGSMVPLLQQLVEAQSKLGGNVTASIVKLSSDAPRIAELTAATLNEEVRSSQPRMHVVEQCLRVGRMLLLTALEVIAVVILAVDGNLAYEALTEPEKAQQHAQQIVATIGHALPLLAWISQKREVHRG